MPAMIATGHLRYDRSMASPRRIGILTGGGDVPGLNAVIKSVVYRATELGYEVVGIRRGWEGLTHQRRGPELDPEYVADPRPDQHADDRPDGRHDPPLVAHQPAQDADRVAAGLAGPAVGRRQAGRATASTTSPTTCSTRSRTWASATWSRSAATTRSRSRAVLHERGLPLVAIPKTMDNDVNGTEYCIGFSSAITRAKEVLNRQRTTLGSHERIGVFRIFGRDAGFTALYTAYVTSTRCVIPEFPYDLEALARDPQGGPPQQPEPLRDRDHRRGRDLGGRADRRTSARPTRSGTATR